MVKDNKIDKNLILSKLRQSMEGGNTNKRQNNAILKEIDSSQFNDALLDEQILGDDSQEDIREEGTDAEDQQIAMEAQH